MSQNVQIQAKINTAEEWAQLIKTQGLVVIDVHSAWCGPCAAIISTFKRFYYEFSDRKLIFVAADCDAIPQLENFKGHSQSTFLFYKDGQLTESVVGVDMPAIVKHIKGLSPMKDDYDTDEEVYEGEELDLETLVPAPGGLQDASDRAVALGRLLTPPPGFEEEVEEEEEEEEAEGAGEGVTEGEGEPGEGGDATADPDGEAEAGEEDAAAGEAEHVPQPPKGRPPSGRPGRPASGARPKGR